MNAILVLIFRAAPLALALVLLLAGVAWLALDIARTATP